MLRAEHIYMYKHRPVALGIGTPRGNPFPLSGLMFTSFGPAPAEVGQPVVARHSRIIWMVDIWRHSRTAHRLAGGFCMHFQEPLLSLQRKTLGDNLCGLVLRPLNLLTQFSWGDRCCIVGYSFRKTNPPAVYAWRVCNLPTLITNRGVIIFVELFSEWSHLHISTLYTRLCTLPIFVVFLSFCLLSAKSTRVSFIFTTIIIQGIHAIFRSLFA